MSRMRLKVQKQIMLVEKDAEQAKMLAKQIVDFAVEIVTEEKESQED